MVARACLLQVDGIYGHGIDEEYVRMKLAAARTVFNALRA